MYDMPTAGRGAAPTKHGLVGHVSGQPPHPKPDPHPIPPPPVELPPHPEPFPTPVPPIVSIAATDTAGDGVRRCDTARTWR